MSNTQPNPQMEQFLRDMFSYPRLANESANDSVKAIASMLHLAAKSILQTANDRREGQIAVTHLRDALTYYIASQVETAVPQQDDNQPSLLVV